MKKNKTSKGPILLAKAIGNERGAHKQAALSMGLVPSQLSPILHGRRMPTLNQAIRLEETFGIPPRAWIVRK